MKIKNLKIGDTITLKTTSSRFHIINGGLTKAKILKFYPNYILLDLGKFTTCAMNHDIINNNWVIV